MVTGVAVATAEVVIVNVALVAPANTLTVSGTVAIVLLEPKVTRVPPGPAGPFRVTNPVELLPPMSDAGDRDKALTVAAKIVSVPTC